MASASSTLDKVSSAPVLPSLSLTDNNTLAVTQSSFKRGRAYSVRTMHEHRSGAVRSTYRSSRASGCLAHLEGRNLSLTRVLPTVSDHVLRAPQTRTTETPEMADVAEKPLTPASR